MSRENGDNGAEPRERILAAATLLFARQGYAATGVRELADEAGVNLSMVNYYFGSKQGLLKALIERFFQRYSEVVMQIAESPGPFEDNIRRFARAVVDLFREDPDMVRIAMTELPMDMPDLAEFKAAKVRNLLSHVYPLFLDEVLAISDRPLEIQVAGPAFVSSITWHFLMRPVIQRIFEMEFDDEFYETFPDRIADLFLYGVVGKAPATGKGD